MTTQKNNPLLGITFMMIAMFAFTSVNALLKTLEQNYNIFQIVFARNVFALIPVYLIIRRARHPFQTHYFKTHSIRAFAGVVSHTCLFSSILLLPFSDANVLSFATTIVVCVMSAFFLRERLDFAHWIAVFVGFAGVALIANPSGNLNTLGVVCALTSVLFESAVMVHNRAFSKHEHPSRIVFYYAIFATLYAIIGMLLSPQFGLSPVLMPTSSDIAKLILFGIGGGLGQYFITESYAHAEARLVAPFIYSAMLWSLAYSVFFFAESLTTQLMIGATLIVGSGIYILRTQQKNMPEKNSQARRV